MAAGSHAVKGATTRPPDDRSDDKRATMLQSEARSSHATAVSLDDCAVVCSSVRGISAHVRTFQTFCLYQWSELHVQDKLVAQRRNALHSEPSDVFALQSVPQPNQLVSWTGRYDHDASMCAAQLNYGQLELCAKCTCSANDSEQHCLVSSGSRADLWDQDQNPAWVHPKRAGYR